MRQYTLLVLFSALSGIVFSQSAIEILQISYEKCQSVRNGHYEMTSHMKFMSGPDTISRSYDCFFSKTESDTVLPALFYYVSSSLDTIRSRQLYTGEELVSMSERDSSAVIRTVQQWASDIVDEEPDDELYAPLTSRKSAPLRSHLEDPASQVYLIGEEIIDTIRCHHVQVIKFPENEPDDMIKITRSVYDFWINTSDAVPVQYAITLNLLLGPDTMVQYERIELKSYELDNISDTSIFTIASIPEYYKLRDYTPHTRPDPLPVGSEAPDWTFPDLDGQEISLRDLRGQIVLLDFFYKSCYPCLQALPALQSLHEQYHDAGLMVIGVDPYDKPEDGIAEFVSRRNIKYSVVLSDKALPEAYLVSGYPTVYLIDQEGRIMHTQVDYGPGSEKELEEIIRKGLVR